MRMHLLNHQWAAASSPKRNTCRVTVNNTVRQAMFAYAVDSFKYAIRSLRSPSFLRPAKIILVPCGAATEGQASGQSAVRSAARRPRTNGIHANAAT